MDDPNSANILGPGENAIFLYKPVVPLDYTPRMKLWVAGRVTYRLENIGARYPVYFARYYDPEQGKFLYYDDPDHESEAQRWGTKPK